MKNSSISEAKTRGNQSLFPGRPRISVAMASCCIAKGSDLVLNALQYNIKEKNIDAAVVSTGCTGLCHAEPTVEVHIPGNPKVIYGNVTEKEIPEIVASITANTPVTALAVAKIEAEEHVLAGSITYQETAPSAGYSDISSLNDLPFFTRQKRLILRNAGTIDPENIDEYIARGGYEALSKALGMTSADIVNEVVTSGLRGRGGGGFPAGIKWKGCLEAKSSKKYIVCNVSEGEPGIGMHRSFLESDPHCVLEGIIIAAYAIGADEAYVYVRDNYRLGLNRIRKAVEDATALGFIGDKVLGSSFSLKITIKEGGGRFVCGEETALIACLEGRVGEPRQRPPFPIEKGLFGKPTCINNVETLANVPLIIQKGSSWYSAIGSDKSKGTKVLSLSGNIARAGMVEVEMGTTLNDIIHEIGGGVHAGKALKGIQTGGPSGGVLPAEMSSLTLEYDSLAQAGSLLGSGGIVIMDEDTDMVKIARYFTDFFVQESCGKCVPCREGVCRLCDILDTITAGRGTKQDIVLLEELSAPITKTSACALGKTSPAPILSTLKHFKNDYLGYIQ